MTAAIQENQGDSAIVAMLAKAIGAATRAANFCFADCLPAPDTGLEVQGLGAVSLPLNRTTLKGLVARCRAAPYGKGTRTLVDRKVRNTYELDPVQFKLGDAWNAALAASLPAIAERLGLPPDRLEARPYKLLLYERGGFFLPHRDSEKQDRMVASLIVALPNPFTGGRLIVRHGSAKQNVDFEEAAAGRSACFAAFYADCEHEVERVTGGARLCLAYNLSLKSQRGRKPASAKTGTASAEPVPVDALARSIGSWVARQPGQPLVFALEHHYTQRGLSLDLLKGPDRQLATLVAAAAAKTDCVAQLAQVSRHLSQFADDGSFSQSYSSRYRRYQPRRHAYELGETYEDELECDQWTDLRGKKQPFGSIGVDTDSIVCSMPLDDWKPTKEEFEGYTGNAGNTLDRWYHRSAIVVWRREHHFKIVARSGRASSIPLFCSMARKLARTPKKKIESARADCIQLARAIIARWPRVSMHYVPRAADEESPSEKFFESLLLLHDRDTIALLLVALAERDPASSIDLVVLAACREFGYSAFSSELKQLIAFRSERRSDEELAPRNLEWLSAICRDESNDPGKAEVVGELCRLAVERFCEPRAVGFGRRHATEAALCETSLPILLKALIAAGQEQALSRVVQFVRQSPAEFSVDHCQAPTLKSLVRWARRPGSAPAPLEAWLESFRQQLESATAKSPEPPADWRRPADVPCNCEYCAKLKSFLADPSADVGRIAAREEVRHHLTSIISERQVDVDYKLEKLRSPYSLVLTKTYGSFERAVKRYEKDNKILGDLPPAASAGAGEAVAESEKG